MKNKFLNSLSLNFEENYALSDSSADSISQAIRNNNIIREFCVEIKKGNKISVSGLEKINKNLQLNNEIKFAVLDGKIIKNDIINEKVNFKQD